jgi:hypothetical protein
MLPTFHVRNCYNLIDLVQYKQKHKLLQKFQILLKQEADSVVESNECRTLWRVLDDAYCYKISVKCLRKFIIRHVFRETGGQRQELVIEYRTYR